MALDSPENEIRGVELSEEELGILIHLMPECPHGKPKDGCPMEKSLRAGNDLVTRSKDLSNMLKNADERYRLKTLLQSHITCARDRA